MAGSIALAAQLGNVLAQGQTQLSEQAVRKYMDYAWQLTPQKFTTPDNKTIVIDKKQRDAVMVPVDVARDVIMQARLTAHAQGCELAEDQVANYRSLMLREENKKKWTEQQLVYISQLHLTVVMMLNGKVKLVEQQGDKQVVLSETEAPSRKLTDEQCKAVREAITTYVKAGPPLNKAEAATPAAVAPAANAPAKK
ncbi:MAG: hypothetical protein ACOYLQ_04875 [Hyphomicrobiaceae bacterium]